MFSRIYDINLSSTSKKPKSISKINRTLLCYSVIFKLLKPQFWSDFEKDFVNYYSLHLLKFLDWELCPEDLYPDKEYWLHEMDSFIKYFNDTVLVRTERFTLCKFLFHNLVA